MTLTKENLVKAIRFNLGYPKSESTKLVESLLEIIKKRLESGENVLITGFGKFCVKDKRERTGRNPATGGHMMLGSRRVVTFRCSSALRKKINGAR
jgi:integration host factor subunit alpha